MGQFNGAAATTLRVRESPPGTDFRIRETATRRAQIAERGRQAMNEDREQDGQASGSAGPTGSGRIADLSESEREMLREFADQLRRRDVRSPVAREALDHAADELERVAATPQT